MSSYTCISCRVVFVDGVTQRSHYKTDWHRYNLKRKVADLPPVTAENFRQRVENAQQVEVSEDKTDLQCKLCGKHFSTQGAMQSHLQSKKHKEAEAKDALRTKKEEEKMNEKNEQMKLEDEGTSTKHHQKDLVNQAIKKDIETSAGSSACGPIAGNLSASGPIAGNQSASGPIAGNQSASGPIAGNQIEEDGETDSDVESVDSFGDEEGLGIEECLFCSHISGSMEQSLEHMSLKHGFFVPDAEFLSDLEGLITYLGQKVAVGNMCLWCNEKGKGFHTTKSVQQHMVDKGHCKMLHDGDAVLEYTDFYDYRSSYPDYDPSKEEEEEEMEVDAATSNLAEEGYELVLPSGATIGHRSLQRYYRQNINPRSGERTQSVLPRMLAQYKALGWTGATGVVAQKRVKDLGAVQRLKCKHFMKLGMKANKFQPHFRAQVMF